MPTYRELRVTEAAVQVLVGHANFMVQLQRIPAWVLDYDTVPI